MELILLGTSGCHLCEEAELIMAGFDQIKIELIDIAEHEQWQDKYAIRIPVLYHAKTGSELGWPFDQMQVQVFIDKCSLLNQD